MDVRRLLLTISQQVWLMTGLTLAILTAFLLIPNVGKRVVYESTAKILLSPVQRTASLNSDSFRGNDANNWLTDQQTLTELITSERLLTRIGNVCGLRTPWQELRERVRIEPLAFDYMHHVNLFTLSVQDASSKQAQKLTEAAVQEFVSYVEELSAREFANTRRFLEELVAEAKEKVDDTEEKLLTITSAHSDVADSAASAESLMTLDLDKRKLQEERSLLEGELGAVQSYQAGQSTVVPTSVLTKSDSNLAQLETSVAAAKLKLIELQQLYTEENIQVVEQHARLNKLQQLYDSRIEQLAQASSDEKGRLIAEKKKSIQAIDARMSELRNRQLTPVEKRQVAKLERQLNMWEENHLSLVKQLYQARVVEQSSRRQGAITILENPGPAVEYREKRTRTLGAQVAIGLPFSLGLSVAIILGIEFLGATLRLVPRIESTLGIPVMAVIPPIDVEIMELWERYKREDTLPRNLSTLLLKEPETP